MYIYNIFISNNYLKSIITIIDCEMDASLDAELKQIAKADEWRKVWQTFLAGKVKPLFASDFSVQLSDAVSFRVINGILLTRAVILRFITMFPTCMFIPLERL